MVERVALAIYAEMERGAKAEMGFLGEFQDDAGVPASDDELVGAPMTRMDGRFNLMAAARRVLEAMREADEHMLEAGRGRRDETGEWNDDALTVYQAMIDEALKTPETDVAGNPVKGVGVR